MLEDSEYYLKIYSTKNAAVPISFFTIAGWHEKLTRKSPEMLAPARIPVAAGKKMANTEKKVSPSLNAGRKFSENTFAVKKRIREKRWIGNEMKSSHFV